ncbi:MAG: ABC transporter permease [Dehalococcoidales bacterium]|nr:ABC transporter permease [Dehalococcoidales bacterium]
MEAKPYLVIKPRKGWQLIDFKELKEYRDLFYILVSRDIKVRYKQTVLGGLWAIIQPFFMMVVFTLFFGNFARVPSDNVPYPIFNYSALVAWTYFANATVSSGNSLIQESALISKVYFPRLIAPLAPTLAFLLDFGIAFIILIGMMLYYQIYPTIMTLFLPLLVILMMFTASGVGMLLAGLNANYRDIRYTITFLVQFWMFASPVVYPVSMIPEKYHLIYALNPMAGIIEGFRSALLGTVAFPTQMLLVSTLVSVIVFISGALYFKRTERYFADVI